MIIFFADSVRPYGLYPTSLLCPLNSPGKNTGVDSRSLLQGIFLTQGLNFGNVHYFENLRALQNYETSTFPVLFQWNNKAWIMAHLFTTWLLNILSSLLRPTAWRKRFLSKYYCSLTAHVITQEI